MAKIKCYVHPSLQMHLHFCHLAPFGTMCIWRKRKGNYNHYDYNIKKKIILLCLYSLREECVFFDQQEDLKQVGERSAVGLALDPLQTSCHLILLNSLHPNISINFLHTFLILFFWYWKGKFVFKSKLLRLPIT